MAQYPESGPTSSYSDPIYDRIDIFAQGIKRHWYLYVLGLLVVVLLAQVVRLMVINRTGVASATTFVSAMDAEDAPTRITRLQALLADEQAAPYYRARAAIELTQDSLTKEDAAGAKVSAGKAVDLAKKSDDAELQYNARLSLAGAEFQAGDLDAAIRDYAEVEKNSKGRFQHIQVESVLGGARSLIKAGKPQDAIAKLEPLTARSDNGAQGLLDLARVMYWKLQYLQANPPPAAVPAPVGADAAGSATAAAVAPSPVTVVPAEPAPVTAPAPAPAK
ncbi:MAG: hypothetical protein H0W83_13200 [Planctomycetes bacterium]|nr:hypothetical protein [Planctomycetota bacterium]